jgi:hypothetical protein
MNPEDEEREQLAGHSAETGRQFHDPRGDVWQRHASGPARDRAADRSVREAIARERDGEYDPATGEFRPSTWS